MSVLPEPYERWAAAFMDGLPEPEPLATCTSCPCAGVTLPAHSKCCSSPALVPNYLAGRVLEQPSVAARIAARRGVGPTGLGNTGTVDPSRWLANPLSSRCPHYVQASGGCGIHPARPALCATYFCRHVRAARGAAAWAALRDTLRLVEPRLALWCAREAGLDPAALRRLIRSGEASDPDGPDPVSDAAWAARWGNFAGRETELYTIAAERVAELPWSRVVEIAGVEAEVLAGAARAAFAALADERIPDRLLVGQHAVVGLAEGTLRLQMHSPHQPYDVSTLVHSVLAFFDGRTTDEALDAMAEQRGLRLDEALLREFIDVGLLVPIPGPAACVGPDGG